VFHRGNRVASHARRYAGPRHGTLPDHMPSAHRRYGEWSATILASDCYNTSDLFLAKPGTKSAAWFRSVSDFEGTSDSSGVAFLANLPVEVKDFGVDHPRFALPAVPTGSGEKRREAGVILIPGQTNHVTVRLEPRDRSPIAHY
jgi:hypothetical protein